MKTFYLFVIALFVAAATLFSFSAGLFNGIENFLEDLLFLEQPIYKDIIIIAIDNESILKIGQWPWPREKFAEFLLILEKSKPKILGIDIMFSEPSRWGAEDDKKLEISLSKISYPVIMPVEKFENEEIKPLEQFKPKINLGNVNLIIDKDGSVRRFLLEDSFALKIAQISNLLKNESALSEINPRVVYAGPPGTFPQIPFWKILAKKIPADYFENKIILVGATAPDLHDEQITPFSKGKPMPGVEIQANIVNMLIQGYRLKDINNQTMAIWILLAALLPIFFFALFKNSLKPIIANAAMGIVHNIGALLLTENNTMPNLVHLNLAWVFSIIGLVGFKYFIGEREKREIKSLFSRYVSRDVLEEILKNPSAAALGGKETEITILFSDIRDFTSISEKITAGELVGFLNKYFDLMSNEILKRRGVVDKYIGDAIMAFWGAPIPDENQTENALEAAIGMISALKKINEEIQLAGKPKINIGIGIYAGPAVVGNIGSKSRFDYTAIGDTVNVASRLESLNKNYNTNIIFGETVKNKLKKQYNIRLLGSVEVKGREQPLNIYTVDFY